MELKEITRLLDYSIKDQKKRRDLVEEIVNTHSQDLTHRDLDKLADYIISAMGKEERKKKEILTNNRMVTVNRRETSYQGMAEKLENGEDGIYNMLSDMGKSILLSPKIEITDEDLENIPNLRELRQEIQEIEEAERRATGKDKYTLKKQLIQMRQQQYILKDDFKKPKTGAKKAAKAVVYTKFDENIWIDPVTHEPVSDGILTLFNPTHVSALLCNYSALKENVYGNFESDLWYVMEELDELVEEALAGQDMLMDLLVYKIDGKKNAEIQRLLEDKYGITHSIEYLSSLWRNKIPRVVADKAKEKYLLWHYTFEEKGNWKRCSKCGQVKLAHNRFFSQNLTSGDGLYSICKKCRNNKEEKEEAEV